MVSTACLEHLSKKLSEMFSMGSHVLPGSLHEKKPLEHGNWNGIVEILYRKKTTLYTWRDSYGLILTFCSSKTNLMGFIVI